MFNQNQLMQFAKLVLTTLRNVTGLSKRHLRMGSRQISLQVKKKCSVVKCRLQVDFRPCARGYAFSAVYICIITSSHNPARAGQAGGYYRDPWIFKHEQAVASPPRLGFRGLLLRTGQRFRSRYESRTTPHNAQAVTNSLGKNRDDTRKLSIVARYCLNCTRDLLA